MKLTKKLTALCVAAMAVLSAGVASAATNATEVITELQGAATGYISAGITAVAVVIVAMFGLLAVFVVARWIKRSLAGR